MPTPTYTPLANITLGSSAASVTFSSISQAYRDLVLIVQGSLTASGSPRVRFNADSGSNYDMVFASGSGSTTYSGIANRNGVSTGEAYAYWTTTDKAQLIMNIMDYSATDKHKSVLYRANNASAGSDMYAARWANTSAINSLVLVDASGNSFAAGSTFALYGIAS